MQKNKGSVFRNPVMALTFLLLSHKAELHLKLQCESPPRGIEPGLCFVQKAVIDAIVNRGN